MVFTLLSSLIIVLVSLLVIVLQAVRGVDKRIARRC